jgi:hypothetical protein
LTTSIVAPALLSLPFAFASLGWAAGTICLVIAAAVTFYSYNLISLVLEHHARQGRRQLRFRDMATDILGQLLNSTTSIYYHCMPRMPLLRVVWHRIQFTGSCMKPVKGSRR